MVAAQQHLNIDLTVPDQPGDLSSWIKKGKLYKDVPEFVSNELLKRLSLSEESKMLLPSELKIFELLAIDLPCVADTTTSTRTPATCFSDMNPNTSIQFLLKRDIPPREILTQLRAAAGQAMLDGKLSIKDWNTEGNIHLPFEALQVWEVLLEAASAKKAWISATKWLASTKGLPTNIQFQIEEIFNNTPWHGRLLALGGHVTVTEMADCFSCLELSGSHVDTLLDVIRLQLLEEDPSNATIIAPTTFFDFLAGIDVYNPAFATTDVKKIGELLGNNPHNTSILGVAYSPPRHWAAIHIESSPSGVLVHWGDSIRRKSPKALTHGIESFLRTHISSIGGTVPLINFRDDLECASQTDGYSCPIIAINTTKHLLFGSELWTEKTRDVLRIKEFVGAMKVCFPICLTAVSPPSMELNTSNINLETDIPTETKPKPPIHPFFLAPPQKQTRKRSHSQGHDPKANVKPSVKKQRTAANAKAEAKERSKTANRKRTMNEEVQNGTFELEPSKWEKFVVKLMELDPNVEVNSTDPKKARLVRHSRCAQWLKMSTVYETSVFKSHVERCEEKTAIHPAANTRTLNAMGVLQVVDKTAQKPTPPAPAPSTWPCSGLSADQDERISQYLKRVLSPSAGGASERKIAQRLFETSQLASLTTNQREAVRIENFNTHRWRNDHQLKRVFAIGKSPCLQTITLPPSHVSGDIIPPCHPCQSLLKLKAFRNAISRSIPDRSNMIFTPHQYQGREIGEKFARNRGLASLFEGSDESDDDEQDEDDGDGSEDGVGSSIKRPKDMIARFARQYVNGNFDKKPVFLDLIAVMTEFAEREARGRGIQNMKYPPAFDDWQHELQCTSGVAFESFRWNFGGRTERSHAHIRSRNPSFTQGISLQTLERAHQYLKDYNYPKSAPLAAGVDDTKLLPSLRPYFDGPKEKWFILGTVGEPMEVIDVNLLQKQIAEAAHLKAEKLRLWTLSIPLPNVPPLVLAASPISSTMKASELAEMEISLLELLLEPSSCFRIISLGSDGAAVEREARRELVRKKFATYTYHFIPHPDPSQPPLKFEILRKGVHAIAVIQDPKHTRKTIRNGMFTGAKCLTLGRYVVNYEQVRNLAFKEDSPLYIRDVEKLDRQDDRAAARLFAARTLEFATEKMADELGFSIYVFVFGEMVDAYESREIAHLDRVQMVLRAHFFKDLWKKFLNEGDYPLAQHFMSKEADDITDIIVNGFMSLIFIHRDYLDKPFPLLPWAHGSQPGEHIFGFLRYYFPDFTMLDVLRLIPKIRVRLMAACKRKKLKGDFKKTASGYSHTYFDGTSANLQHLAVFPTDEEIQSIATAAYDEAVSLWALLGYSTGENPSTAFKKTNESVVDVEGATTETTDGDDSICCESIDPTETLSDRQALEDALAEATDLHNKEMPSNKIDTALDECGYAAAALNISDIDRIESIPSDDPAALEEIRLAVATILATIAASNESGREAVMQLIKQAEESRSNGDSTLPISTNDSAEVSYVIPAQAISSMSDTDLSDLVKIRMKHQCREGAEGIRTRKNVSEPSSATECQKPLSDRQKLANKIHEIVRLAESEKGQSSGLNRRIRWEKTAPGSTNGAAVLTGNVANAQMAARSAAGEIVKRRRAEFTSIGGINPDDLATAKVDMLSKLARGSFGVVAYEEELMIGKIVTVYEKGGGKAARHAWVHESTSVGSVSYISMQIWKQTSRNQRNFRAIWHPKLKQHALPRFAHIPAAAFILKIPNSFIRSHNNEASLELAVSFFETTFSKLLAQDKAIFEAVKRLSKRLKRKDAPNDEDTIVE